MMLSPLFVFSPGRALLALLAFALSSATCVYARRYFEGADERRFFMYGSLAFLLSVWGTLFSAYWITFAVFMEISTAFLFSLIALKERDVALRYFVVQLVGAAFLLAGIGAAYAGHGPALVGPVPKDALPFFVLGLGVKAALPVLHFWLPEVHGRAPAPVSALLSGMAVKIGAFGLLQALGADGPNFLAPVGAIMALWGVALALAQHDMKRLLAYHTVSQLGYVIAAVGAGSASGWCGALYHMAAHGLFKSMLFLCAGVLEKVYGTRALDRLGGAWKTLPFTCVLYVVAAAAIAGLPGTIGFASKSVVKSALFEHMLVSFALLAANVGTVMSFCKMGWFAFGGSERSTPLSFAGVRSMNVALLPLAGMVVLFGFFP
ncbi:MAG TPA: proton-conducting transporter membrane subunit, partial [Synergistales bacterium]|nr:proton-conducting transporter membrane subunit [Synergistales bacterium]